MSIFGKAKLAWIMYHLMRLLKRIRKEMEMDKPWWKSQQLLNGLLKWVASLAVLAHLLTEAQVQQITAAFLKHDWATIIGVIAVAAFAWFETQGQRKATGKAIVVGVAATNAAQGKPTPPGYQAIAAKVNEVPEVKK